MVNLTKSQILDIPRVYLEIAGKLPVLPEVKRRLDRAYDMVRFNGEGEYTIVKVQSDCYQVHKSTTSMFEDNSHEYELTRTNKQWYCDCPDYDKAPMNMCKHRLAVMMIEELTA